MAGWETWFSSYVVSDRFLVSLVLAAVVSAACSQPASRPSTSASARSTPSPSDRPESAEEWRRQFREAMGDWQRAFQTYSEEYASYTTRLNSWTPADGTLAMALSQASDGITETLDRLDEMEDAYQRLLPLVDVALENDGIPEISSGQVSESDVRRYFAVVGDYIDSSRKGLIASKKCYSLPPSEAVVCSVDYSQSREASEALTIVAELDDLQFKIFGQHLTPV